MGEPWLYATSDLNNLSASSPTIRPRSSLSKAEACSRISLRHGALRHQTLSHGATHHLYTRKLPSYASCLERTLSTHLTSQLLDAPNSQETSSIASKAPNPYHEESRANGLRAFGPSFSSEVHCRTKYPRMPASCWGSGSQTRALQQVMLLVLPLSDWLHTRQRRSQCSTNYRSKAIQKCRHF